MGFLVLLDLLTGKNEKPETGLNLFQSLEESKKWLHEYLETNGARVIRASIYDKATNDRLYFIENLKNSSKEGITFSTKLGASFSVTQDDTEDPK